VDSEYYGRALSTAGFDIKKWENLSDCGSFLFVPTGGGDPSRPADYYGEAIITEKYLEKITAELGFELKKFDITNDMPQAFVVMQKY
jgi:hypothetical protein